MEFDVLKKQRRSCRAYQEGTMSAETLSSIIEDARFAPSWKNSQTARFYAVLEKDKLASFSDNFLPDFNQDSTKNASCYLVCTFERGQSGCLIAGKYVDKKGDMWGAYDLGCAISYLILSAENHGYQSLIMGLYNEDKIRQYFAIPNSQEIMGVLALGKKEKELTLRPRKAISEILQIK